MTGIAVQMVSAPVLRAASKVSLVVGTCLNLINQGSAVLHGAPVDWGKAALNFAVPLLVSSYSAAKARIAVQQAGAAGSDVGACRS